LARQAESREHIHPQRSTPSDRLKLIHKAARPLQAQFGRTAQRGAQ